MDGNHLQRPAAPMHSIRLRGPWEFSIAGTDVSGRTDFPCDWMALPTASATVRFRRSFHLPTGLKPQDRVLLALQWSGRQAIVQLNGIELPLQDHPDGSHHADVTLRLIPRNDLTIDLVPPSPALLESAQPILEATLQIYSP